MEVPCPLCGSSNYSVYTMAPSHYGPERCQVTQCRQCDMVFTNPQQITYEAEVENRGALTRHLEPGPLNSSDRQARLQLKLIARFKKPPGSIFDFGCGAGALVKAAVDEGWSSVGLDLNRGLVAAANAHWKFDNLKSGPLSEFIAETKERFDVIVSNQVFEHLQKPVGLGRELVEKLLKLGGIILIDVPNVHQPKEWFSKGRTLDPTSHWCHFSQKTLSLLLEKIGCEVLYTSASPALVGIFQKAGFGNASFSAGAFAKRVLPPLGTGVCAIGRRIS